MPVIRQIFVGRAAPRGAGEAFGEKTVRDPQKNRGADPHFRIKICGDFYVCSLSHRTIVYKGQLISFRSLSFIWTSRTKPWNPALRRSPALSTNTFPSWKRAHPYRYIIHNGEINTLRGNINWMRARESIFKSDLSAKTSKNFCPRSIPTAPTAPCSTTPSSFSSHGPLPPARHDDDDSRGLDRKTASWSPASALFTNTIPA